MSISIFRNHVLAAQRARPRNGAVDLNPTNAGGVALLAAVNNPHAALLFVDFC
jgi:hypothetical protein